ncbi:hypothetical protein LCGC14_1466000 [marine sediment metagenome]|uniref:CHASE3 domain-containing protein n=1 Tax=marine sediment metagenome TaxID=412755 RepID=A0A0F9JDS4_9ZZZZ
MIFQRGVGKSVMALKVNDQDMLYDGIDLIEATIGYISTKDYFTDELNNTLIPYIDTVISEIEEINAGYLQKGVPVPREAIMKISDISDEMFRLLSKEDFDNWNKLSYDNSKLSGQFKLTSTLIIIILIIVSTMLVVLIRSLRFRKNAENALKDAHDKLEIKVQERTQELSELNINLEQEIKERKRAEEKIEKSLKEKRSSLKKSTTGSRTIWRLSPHCSVSRQGMLKTLLTRACSWKARTA